MPLWLTRRRSKQLLEAVLGYEDVFTKIEMCRRHYAAVGLGASYVDRYVR